MNGLALFDRAELLGIQTETPHYRILKYQVWLGREVAEYFILQQMFTMKVPRHAKRKALIEVEYWKDIWEGTRAQIEELQVLLTLFEMNLQRPRQS